MFDGREARHFLTESVFRTAEIGLALVLLLVVSVGLWVVTTQPGSPDGGGTVVGLVVLAGVVSVLLASIVIVHAIVDFGRFVAP